jgi:hypothetical protein
MGEQVCRFARRTDGCCSWDAVRRALSHRDKKPFRMPPPAGGIALLACSWCSRHHSDVGCRAGTSRAGRNGDPTARGTIHPHKTRHGSFAHRLSLYVLLPPLPAAAVLAERFSHLVNPPVAESQLIERSSVQTLHRETANSARHFLAKDSGPQAYTVTGRVVAITDGDTLTVLDDAKVQHKIRLADQAKTTGTRFGCRSPKS